MVIIIYNDNGDNEIIIITIIIIIITLLLLYYDYLYYLVTRKLPIKYTLHDYVGLYCRRSNTKSNIELKRA